MKNNNPMLRKVFASLKAANNMNNYATLVSIPKNEATQQVKTYVKLMQEKGSAGNFILSDADKNLNLSVAQLLASQRKRPLYRVNLSKITSKYIGETEKNINAVFKEAEELNAILLLDEIDALFGKRTEVKDSHDKYANTEVSYLLQRIQQFNGTVLINCVTMDCRKWQPKGFVRMDT